MNYYEHITLPGGLKHGPVPYPQGQAWFGRQRIPGEKKI